MQWGWIFWRSILFILPLHTFMTYCFNFWVKWYNFRFDTMNSRVEKHPNPLLCGMGEGLFAVDQMKVLDDMEKFLDDFSVFSNDGKLLQSKQPWQIGMQCSIKSTHALYDELVKNGPFRYLLTSRLNQDCLENFFSRIRGNCQKFYNQI